MHFTINELKILEFYSNQATKNPSKKMVLRVGHIKDVVRHSDAISDAIGLDAYGKTLARLIAYLHDYYQVLQIAEEAPDPHLHHSHPDAIEKVLFSKNQIDQYAEGLSGLDKAIIKTAIVQHAKIAVSLTDEEKLNPHFALFCDIIRDADKSAIYELIQEPLYVLHNDWGFTDNQIAESGVSEKVLQDFMSRKSVTNSDIKTPADWAISQLGYLWNVKTDFALKSMLQSAATLMGNLPFSAETNAVVRGCYYHALNALILVR